MKLGDHGLVVREASKIGCSFRIGEFNGHTDFTKSSNFEERKVPPLNSVSKQLLAMCLAFWAHFVWCIFFIPVNDWPNVDLTSHSDVCSSCTLGLVAERHLTRQQEEHVSVGDNTLEAKHKQSDHR